MVLVPGESGSFAVSVEYNGYIDLYDIEMLFDYQGQAINIGSQSLTIGELGLGNLNNQEVVTITASDNLINGSLTSIPINIFSSNGYQANLSASVQIGYVSSSDPLGPDEYGYLIYDSGDTDYDLAPEYDWIEIDPDYGGNGDVIDLNGNGLSDLTDNGDNLDDVETIDLPFPFTYYGICLLYTSPSPRDATLSRMPSSA